MRSSLRSRASCSPEPHCAVVTKLVYEVAFKGTATESLRANFADCDVTADHGLTVMRCAPDLLTDVLERLESLGLELLDVRLIAEPS
jgi:hypothetical protein